jgi:hypothetical protein
MGDVPLKLRLKIESRSSSVRGLMSMGLLAVGSVCGLAHPAFAQESDSDADSIVAEPSEPAEPTEPAEPNVSPFEPATVPATGSSGGASDASTFARPSTPGLFQHLLEVNPVGLTAFIMENSSFLGEASVGYEWSLAAHMTLGADLFFDRSRLTDEITEQTVRSEKTYETAGQVDFFGLAPKFRYYLSPALGGLFAGVRIPLGWALWELDSTARDANGEELNATGDGFMVAPGVQVGYRAAMGRFFVSAYSDVSFGVVRPDIGEADSATERDLPNLNGLGAEDSWDYVKEKLENRADIRVLFALTLGFAL